MTTIEDLRSQLFAREASASARRREEVTSIGRAHAIANGMPFLFGYFTSIDDPECPVEDRKLFQRIMNEQAQKLGFETSQDLKKALEELREQLRSELSEEDWLGYFG